MKEVLAIGWLILAGSSLAIAQHQKRVPGLIRFNSEHSSFPDTLRAKGHTYQGTVFSYEKHYDSKEILVVIPPGFTAQTKVDMVFWFHGWYNTIDSSLQVFKLADQFIASNRKAILVIPETAKNAPDSYGGKLESPGMFQGLVKDVLDKLKQYGDGSQNYEPGHILLAGHSGAYRVIAHILQEGGLPIQEVLLFDGLYGQLDTFRPWILSDKQHSFIHWYTNKGGGTDEMSDTLMAMLDREGKIYGKWEEKIPLTQLPRKQQVLFVHSAREHNQVINDPDNFKLLLQRSRFLKKIRKGSRA